MKLSHNKKRNTALIYEIVISELSRVSLDNQENKKTQIISLLKEHYGKNKLLRRELDIYQSFEDLQNFDEKSLARLIEESRRQYRLMDRQQVFEEQSTLINKINKILGPSVWKNFVSSFRKYATINQMLQENTSPKKQIIIENKLFNELLKIKNDQEGKKFPKINNLAMKTFVEKFNDTYSDSLNESQKTILKNYIFSYTDNGLQLKASLYKEIEKIKNSLNEKSAAVDGATKQKIDKVLDKISTYNRKKIDQSVIYEVFQVQQLVSELDKKWH